VQPVWIPVWFSTLDELKEKRKKKMSTAPPDLRRSVRIRERCACQETSSTAPPPTVRTRAALTLHTVSCVVPMKGGGTSRGTST
jgi:hypothetical protein